MKISKEQIERVSGMILQALKDKDLVEFKADEARVLTRINDAILKDIRAEEDLDREVERMLEAHSGALDGEKIDYRRMFNMIKTKLARERGIVL